MIVGPTYLLLIDVINNNNLLNIAFKFIVKLGYFLCIKSCIPSTYP